MEKTMTLRLNAAVVRLNAAGLVVGGDTTFVYSAAFNDSWAGALLAEALCAWAGKYFSCSASFTVHGHWHGILYLAMELFV